MERDLAFCLPTAFTPTNACLVFCLNLSRSLVWRSFPGFLAPRQLSLGKKVLKLPTKPNLTDNWPLVTTNSTEPSAWNSSYLRIQFKMEHDIRNGQMHMIFCPNFWMACFCKKLGNGLKRLCEICKWKNFSWHLSHQRSSSLGVLEPWV